MPRFTEVIVLEGDLTYDTDRDQSHRTRELTPLELKQVATAQRIIRDSQDTAVD